MTPRALLKGLTLQNSVNRLQVTRHERAPLRRPIVFLFSFSASGFKPLPMNTILIIAHAPFAQALRACAMHVFPDCAQQVLALDVQADESFEQTFAAACQMVSAQQGHDLLVLTDVFGATPSNVAQRLLQHCAAQGVQVREVTGVNLPMLLRVICYAALPLHELEQYALTGGTQGMFAVDIATGAPVCTLSPTAVAPPNAEQEPGLAA